MGFDIERFSGKVNEGLLCSICRDVLEEPLQAPCEHAFCSACIQAWLTHYNSCPEDRLTLWPSDLKPIFRYMKNDLNALKIRCDNESRGCKALVRLDALKTHLKEECGHVMVFCSNEGCEEKYTRRELETHMKNCKFQTADCARGCGLKVSKNGRIHRMIATMAGNVAKRSKDELVIGVAKHMEYAARSGYLAEEKYDHVVVILNAAIADMDSGSIGRVTSYGHLVPTRDDLDWLLAHMEGIKGIPPRAEEMNQGDAHTFDSKAGAYSAGGPWTNAQVKYCYDQYLSLSAKIALDCAMGKVRQELPGIEFINVGYKGPDACNTHPAIYIQSSNTGCWADIGMSIEDFTGNQKLNLGVPGCTDCGTAIHELLHSMGMAHEQSRPDRDTFVEIKWDNIMSSMYSQFAKDPHADTSVDYDIMSIMHDGRFHWSNNGKETIVVKEAGYRLYTDDPGQHRYAIGQHIMMTQNDVRQLANMYNCTSNTICGTGRTDVRNVNNGAPSASIKGQTDIFHGYQSVSYVTAAAFSLVASSLACCCFCSFSISQSKNEDSRSLLCP